MLRVLVLTVWLAAAVEHREQALRRRLTNEPCGNGIGKLVGLEVVGLVEGDDVSLFDGDSPQALPHCCAVNISEVTINMTTHAYVDNIDPEDTEMRCIATIAEPDASKSDKCRDEVNPDWDFFTWAYVFTNTFPPPGTVLDISELVWCKKIKKVGPALEDMMVVTGVIDDDDEDILVQLSLSLSKAKDFLNDTKEMVDGMNQTCQCICDEAHEDANATELQTEVQLALDITERVQEQIIEVREMLGTSDENATEVTENLWSHIKELKESRLSTIQAKANEASACCDECQENLAKGVALICEIEDEIQLLEGLENHYKSPARKFKKQMLRGNQKVAKFMEGKAWSKGNLNFLRDP